MDWSIPRSSAGVLVMVGLARDAGLSDEQTLAGTGLDVDAVASPDSEVQLRQELAVIANIVDSLGDRTGLGVRAGARYQLTTYGVFGFALISSPTLREAVEIGLRYFDLTYAFSTIEPRVVDDRFELVFTAPDVPEVLRRFVVERDLAAVRTIGRDLVADPNRPFAARFAFDEPNDVEPYAEVFGVRPEFGCDETLLHMPRDGMDVPLPRADAQAAAFAQAQCRELLRTRAARSGLAARVQDLLTANPANPPSAEAAAAALAMSTRSLRHRLAAEGASYRALLQEMRSRLAEEMLVGGRLTVTETAQRLGYVEVSSFSQAFRRWHGCGPAEYVRLRTGR
ncbi:AraC family transcriptional regulator [Gordonia sp. (in: high G+C Gram-positive bacteria)]|uniref:AraC family transcriptional regulator n=1 Tax=Gordonia sp. (in: high G+C Gram-positive bacteria) TaxID=84139 RepID=UPI003F958A01